MISNGLPLHVRQTMRLMQLTKLEQQGLLPEANRAELIQLRIDIQAEFQRLARNDLARPDHPFHKLRR